MNISFHATYEIQHSCEQGPDICIVDIIQQDIQIDK